MSEAPRYRVHLRGNRGRLDAVDVDWLTGRLRVVLSARRLEVDHDAGEGHHVPDGVRVREYPAAAVNYVEDLDPPEAHP